MDQPYGVQVVKLITFYVPLCLNNMRKRVNSLLQGTYCVFWSSVLACHNDVFVSLMSFLLTAHCMENRRSQFLERKIGIHILARIVQPYSGSPQINDDQQPVGHGSLAGRQPNAGG